MPSQGLERLICVKDSEVLEEKNCDRANDALGLQQQFQTVMFCTCVRDLRQGLT